MSRTTAWAIRSVTSGLFFFLLSFVLYFSLRSNRFASQLSTDHSVEKLNREGWLIEKNLLQFHRQRLKMVRQKFVVNSAADSSDGNPVVSHLKAFGTRLIARKSITQLQSEAEGGNELKRTLGTFQVIALGVGSIIGECHSEWKRSKSEVSDRYWHLRVERRSRC